MEKRHLDRRLAQMEAEGTRFRPGVAVGEDVTGTPAARPLRRGGARRGRDGVARDCRAGPRARRRPAGHGVPAAGQPPGARASLAPAVRRGDGGGQGRRDHRRRRHRRRLPGHRALRQGARSVTQLEIMPRPPEERPQGQPWPTYPMIYRVVERPRGGRRPALLGQHPGLPRRRGGPRPCPAADRGRVRRRPVHTGGGLRAGDPRPARAAGDGLHGPGARAAAGAAGGRARRSAATCGATTPSRRACRACSWPGTPAAGSRSSSGRSPRAVHVRPRSTAG